MHESCIWPPPPGAAEDGYGSVVINGLSNPDSANASDDAIVWTFESSCQKIVVPWWLTGGGNGGITSLSNTETYVMGQVLDGQNQPAFVPEALREEIGEVDSDSLFIIETGGIYPRGVTCTA